MEERSLIEPVPIPSALRSLSDESLMTVAAFLLIAGIWHQKRFIEDNTIIPEDVQGALHLNDWPRLDLRAEPIDLRASEFRPYLTAENFEENRGRYYEHLGYLIEGSLKSGKCEETAKTVAFGMASPDELVRICALISATEIFRVSPDDFMPRLLWFNRRKLGETTTQLLAILVARLLHSGLSFLGQPITPGHGPGQVGKPGVMLIHGTNFPPFRPLWSVPGTGPLFNYIRRVRTDVYSAADYYRWEGGYSDYAREVAALNLDDWIVRRNLSGIDAITHSHGGNVLMKATQGGPAFNKVIFMNCPVRWTSYQPRTGSIKTAISIRLKFDFVILADRAGQRFPQGSNIAEHILPIWFVSHSATTEPATWQTNNLSRFL